MKRKIFTHIHNQIFNRSDFISGIILLAIILSLIAFAIGHDYFLEEGHYFLIYWPFLIIWYIYITVVKLLRRFQIETLYKKNLAYISLLNLEYNNLKCYFKLSSLHYLWPDDFKGLMTYSTYFASIPKNYIEDYSSIPKDYLEENEIDDFGYYIYDEIPLNDEIKIIDEIKYDFYRSSRTKKKMPRIFVAKIGKNGYCLITDYELAIFDCIEK